MYYTYRKKFEGNNMSEDSFSWENKVVAITGGAGLLNQVRSEIKYLNID